MHFFMPALGVIAGGVDSGEIKFLPSQLSPPAITPKAGIKKFIDQLELYIDS